VSATQVRDDDPLAERSPLPVALRAPAQGAVLVFAPHPDDDLLGAGLTLRLHRLQGDPVHMVIVYDGASGGSKGPPQDPAKRAALAAQRRKEALLGGAHFDLRSYEFWDYPEGHLPGPQDLVAAARRVAQCVRRVQPHTVYAPWVGEYHTDHHALARAVRLGLRAAGFAKDAWGYEVWSPLQPTHIVDVTDGYERKAAALAEHASQIEGTDLVHMVRGLNAHRSLYLPKGARYGEAFAPLGNPHPQDAALLPPFAPPGG